MFNKLSIPNIFKRSPVKITRKTKGPIWILALVLSIIAGISVYWTFNSIYEPSAIIVANRDLNALEKVEPEDIKEVYFSKRDRHSEAVSNPDEVIGTYTRVPILKDEPILKPKVIRNPDQMVNIEETMNPNETILVLKDKQVIWPQLLKGGDLVSVVAVYSEGAEDITRKAKVAGENLPTPVIGNFESMAKAEPEPKPEITLVMDREDAKKVMTAIVNAKMVYVLPEWFNGG